MATTDTFSGSAQPRSLTSVLVPPGLAGVTKMWHNLTSALDGSGPAIVPIPDDGSRIAQDILDATRPNNPEYPLENDDIAIICATSGSTGAPRGVMLTRQALQASITGFANRFGADARWVVSMPVHRIAGIMVLARSFINHNPHVVDPSVGGAVAFHAATFSATTKHAFSQSARDGLPLMVSLVPTQIARLLDAGTVGIEALRAYDVVLSGAAATPQPMLERLRELNINVVVSYGMSETCGGCVFNGQPLDGVSVSLGSQTDDDPGRIMISGPVLASGYRLRPDLDAVSFIDGRLQTHDVGRLDSRGYLHVIGRLDDVVIVGGVNVALSAVESAIRHHPDITDVAVVDVADDLWGSLPIAYVVTKLPVAQRSVLTKQIKEHVASRIGRAATPRTVAYVETLPLLDSGKVDRLGLRLQAAKDIAQNVISHPGLSQYP